MGWDTRRAAWEQDQASRHKRQEAASQAGADQRWRCPHSLGHGGESSSSETCPRNAGTTTTTQPGPMGCSRSQPTMPW